LEDQVSASIEKHFGDVSDPRIDRTKLHKLLGILVIALPFLATWIYAPAEVRKFCALDETGQALMKTAMAQLQLSARAYHRILKLARTIADLAGSETI
jgi:hypothetical protein